MILQSYDSFHRTVVYHKLRPSPRTRRSIDRDQRAAYPRSPTPGKPWQTPITATFQLHCATSSNSAPMRNLSQSSKNFTCFSNQKDGTIVILEIFLICICQVSGFVHSGIVWQKSFISVHGCKTNQQIVLYNNNKTLVCNIYI